MRKIKDTKAGGSSNMSGSDRPTSRPPGALGRNHTGLASLRRRRRMRTLPVGQCSQLPEHLKIKPVWTLTGVPEGPDWTAGAALHGPKLLEPGYGREVQPVADVAAVSQ